VLKPILPSAKYLITRVMRLASLRFNETTARYRFRFRSNPPKRGGCCGRKLRRRRRIGPEHTCDHYRVPRVFAWYRPYQLIHQELEARSTATTVEIFHQGKRVAAHPRSFLPGKFTTLEEHLSGDRRRLVSDVSSFACATDEFRAECLSLWPTG